MTTTTLQNPDNQTKKAPAWRDVLPVHPAADLFPRMGKDELQELANDIKKNGLLEGIVLYDAGPGIKSCVLDGRNRLDALELLGRETVNINGHPTSTIFTKQTARKCFDPYRYVISKNIHRRHLTGEQKREVIAWYVKEKPELSNRTIAKQVKASHHTVGVARAKLESTGQIAQLKKTKGKDGKSRPVRRKVSPTKPELNTTPTNPARLATGGLAHLWGESTPEQRSKFIDLIGLDAIFAAAPRNLQELFLAQLSRGATL